MSKLLKVVRGLLILIVLGLTGLYFATRGNYQLALTVTEDPSLPTITLNNYQFHAETFGNPEHTLILVLHGGPGDDYSYQYPLKALSEDYFVVFYDQRGTGLSPRVPASELTLDIYLEDVNAFVDRFSPGRPAILLGHSWGGMLATAYTGKYPDKVSKLILAAPGPLSQEAQNVLQAAFAAISRSLWPRTVWPYLQSLHIQNRETRADFFYSQTSQLWFHHPDNAYHCEQPVTHQAWRPGATVATTLLASIAREPQGIDILRQGIENFQGETLFLVGECDDWLGKTLQERQMQYFQRARLEVVNNVGHVMFIENIEATLEPIRQFLQ